MSNPILLQGDCLQVLKSCPSGVFQAVVTDPPYGLGEIKDIVGFLSSWLLNRDESQYRGKKGFLGKDWDAGVPGPPYWKEIFRVLCPGAHILVFAGTRTWDLMSLALRLAGFENRDTIASEIALRWIQGEGFPKSHKLLDGTWGTGLKPSWEPILLFRKPCVGSAKENSLSSGTGGIAIDACRVPFEQGRSSHSYSSSQKGIGSLQEQAREEGFRPYVTGLPYQKKEFIPQESPLGRWPANVLFSHQEDCTQEQCASLCPVSTMKDPQYFSSFFYCPKAKKKEREAGCENLEGKRGFDKNTSQQIMRTDPETGEQVSFSSTPSTRRNYHPTVKPLTLLRWLVRLVTPPGGNILDPFCGSGSTGIAAFQEDMNFYGIEKEEDYSAIAQARFAHWTKDERT